MKWTDGSWNIIMSKGRWFWKDEFQNCGWKINELIITVLWRIYGRGIYLFLSWQRLKDGQHNAIFLGVARDVTCTRRVARDEARSFHFSLSPFLQTWMRSKLDEKMTNRNGKLLEVSQMCTLVKIVSFFPTWKLQNKVDATTQRSPHFICSRR